MSVSDLSTSMPKLQVPLRQTVSVVPIGASVDPYSEHPTTEYGTEVVDDGQVKVGGVSRPVVEFNGNLDDPITMNIFDVFDKTYAEADKDYLTNHDGISLRQAFQDGDFERYAYSTKPNELMINYGGDYWLDKEPSTGVRISFDDDGEWKVELVAERRDGSNWRNLEDIFGDLHAGNVEVLYDSAKSEGDPAILRQLFRDIDRGSNDGSSGGRNSLRTLLSNYVETLTFKARNSDNARERRVSREKYLELAKILQEMGGKSLSISGVNSQAQQGLKEDGIEYGSWKYRDLAAHYLSMNDDRLDSIARGSSDPAVRAKALVEELFREHTELTNQGFYSERITRNQGLEDYAHALQYGLSQMGIELDPKFKLDDFIYEYAAKDHGRELNFDALEDAVTNLPFSGVEPKKRTKITGNVAVAETVASRTVADAGADVASSSAAAKDLSEAKPATTWKASIDQILKNQPTAGFRGLGFDYNSADLQNLAWLMDQNLSLLEDILGQEEVSAEAVLKKLKVGKGAAGFFGVKGLVGDDKALVIIRDIVLN